MIEDFILQAQIRPSDSDPSVTSLLWNYVMWLKALLMIKFYRRTNFLLWGCCLLLFIGLSAFIDIGLFCSQPFNSIFLLRILLFLVSFIMMLFCQLISLRFLGTVLHSKLVKRLFQPTRVTAIAEMSLDVSSHCCRQQIFLSSALVLMC